MAFSANDSGSGAPKADINVVPLVDVLLVLLIIFMVTAPLMSHKIKVELPEANLDKIDETKNKVQPITLAVTEDGDVYWNDQAVTRDVLESQLAVEAQKTPQPAINIRGDKTTKYRAINEVVNLAQAKGMRKVGFVATKETNH
ncbi:MAG: biopolymer transporter ExbD [Luteimonas sp.]|nr:biopolymer transporter ExbD [Luteimonas sp.]